MALPDAARYAAGTSSVLLRLLAYIFLRWVNIAPTFAPELFAPYINR